MQDLWTNKTFTRTLSNNHAPRSKKIKNNKPKGWQFSEKKPSRAMSNHHTNQSWLATSIQVTNPKPVALIWVLDHPSNLLKLGVIDMFVVLTPSMQIDANENASRGMKQAHGLDSLDFGKETKSPSSSKVVWHLVWNHQLIPTGHSQTLHNSTKRRKKAEMRESILHWRLMLSFHFCISIKLQCGC